MKSLTLIQLFISLFAYNNISAQSWVWAKNSPVYDGIPTLPRQTKIDSRGNTIILSSKLHEEVISKFDINGVLLWKRGFSIVNPLGPGLTTICIDAYDNIYIAISAFNKLDTVTVSSPAPYSLVKLNQNGRLLWANKIDYSPMIFAPGLISSGDKLFLLLSIPAFTSLSYKSIIYTNIAGNTPCSFVASLDTAGNLIWSKRIYSALSPSCIVDDTYPNLSTNSNNELLLTGWATNKLVMETVPLINYPLDCREYKYGVLLDGNTANVKWAKELILDSLTKKPNLDIFPFKPLSTVLQNGYSIIYDFTTQDTGLGTNFQRHVEMTNKIYLYNGNGDMVRKDSLGRLDTGYYAINQLCAGEAVNFYTAGLYIGFSPGRIIETRIFEARKWDTTFSTIWKHNTVYTNYFPYFQPVYNIDYNKKYLNTILQSGSEDAHLTYAYFGADSLVPYLNNLVARIEDSSNYISGNVYFDLNRNKSRDIGEPMAPNIMIGNAAGDTIYAITNSKGFYNFKANPGNYSLKPLNVAATFPDYTDVSPSLQTISMSGYGSYLLNKNFQLNTNNIVTDGTIYLDYYRYARPGGTAEFKPSITNTGGLNFSGSYDIIFDSTMITYVSSQVQPKNINPNSLTFTLNTLSPLDTVSNDVIFRIKPNVVLFDTLKVKAVLNTVPTDVLPLNNSDSVNLVIKSSFDPNSKEVTPTKDIQYDSVIAGHKELEYILRFQNTGNDTAFTVLVQDTLDYNKLDLSSFHLIQSSHPVNLIWNKPSGIGFYFSNILLPDSGINELKSHGFIRFRIKPKTSIQLSDLIKNTASIYFDYNKPVQTNTVVTNFIKTIITGLNDNTIDTKGLVVSPNPAKNTIYFKVIKAAINERMTVGLYDISGKKYISQNNNIVSNTQYSLDITKLAKGVYYLELKGKKNWFVKKVVVQ